MNQKYKMNMNFID